MLVRGCSCATSLYDLDLTFDIAIVTLTHKHLSGLQGFILKTIRCRRLKLGRDINWLEGRCVLQP